MKNCTSPYAHTSGHVFVATNVVLQPLLFGVGIIGNLLILVTLNHRLLRTASAIYIYLTGLAACELLVLLMAAPRAVRDTALIPLPVGHAKEMAQYMSYEYGFRHILSNSSTWCVALVLLVRYVTMTSPLRKRRLTTNSASRIIVFVTVVFCLVVNFPRFFELQVVELRNHCLEGLVLWDWDYTPFATRALYLQVYPWVIVTAVYILPFCLILLLGTLIALRIRLFHVLRQYVKVTSAVDGNELQLSIMLVMMAMTYFLLEFPKAVSHIIFAVHPERLPRPLVEYSSLTLMSECLSALNASLHFILYMLLSRDIRKAFRRAFCCVCITGDEYYEPMTCVDILTCGYTYNRIPKETSTRASSTASSSSKVRPPSTPPTPVHGYPPRHEHRPIGRYQGPNVSKDGWI